MPGTARGYQAGYAYHVLNRGNARAEVFQKESDYQAFVEMMAEASLRVPMRVIAYCLVPNHVHLGLWPAHGGDLSRWIALAAHVSQVVLGSPKNKSRQRTCEGTTRRGPTSS
jgi:putative transposase